MYQEADQGQVKFLGTREAMMKLGAEMAVLDEQAANGLIKGNELHQKRLELDIKKIQISAQIAEQQKQLQGEIDIIEKSTDENEILEALLRQRELSGAAEQTREINVEGTRAKNQ